MNCILKSMSALLMLFAFAPSFAQTPTHSLYRLNIGLTDQDGRDFHLDDRAGKPQLVSMFYASCQYTCPLTVEALKRNQNALPADERAKLQVLLVSFDSKRDTPPRLKEVEAQRNIDASTWTLAHAEPPVVRTLAAALDFKYRELANGDFSHSSTIVLLSADGQVLAHTENLTELDPDFVRALHTALRRGG